MLQPLGSLGLSVGLRLSLVLFRAYGSGCRVWFRVLVQGILGIAAQWRMLS